MEKLSEREWGVNQRILTLDDASVAYYSKVPKEGDYSAIMGRKVDPKQSVALAHVVEVRALATASMDGAASDKAQVKKFGKQKTSQMFRITFYAGALVEGEASARHARRELEPQEKEKLKTWYFCMAEDDRANGTAGEWIVTLNARCLMEKNPDFEVDPHVVTQLKEDPNFKHLVLPKGVDVQGGSATRHNQNNSPRSGRDGPRSPRTAGGMATHREISEESFKPDRLRVSIEDAARQEDYTSAEGRSSGPDKGHPARQAEATGRGTAGQQRQSRRAGADGRWDQQFQNLWSCIVAADGNFAATMTLSEKLFHLAGQFNQEATRAVTTIVDEMHLPADEREYLPEGFLEPQHAMFYDSESDDFDGSLGSNSLVYLMPGMLVKLCRYGQKANRVNHRDLKKWEKAYEKLPFKHGCPSLAEPQMRKQFSRELNAAELFFDALFMTSSIDSKYRLRCPLMCKVDYRGFRAIAIATMPIRPERGMALGFDSDGKLQQLDGQLTTELQDVGQVLNLSDYKTKVKKTLFDGKSGGGGGTASQHQLAVEVQQFESVPISNFVKVYSQAEGTIEELRSTTLKALRRETRQLIRSHYIEPVQYVLKTDNIFPMDLDYEGHQKVPAVVKTDN